MMIDTHCHIHDSKFFPEIRDEVYLRSVAAGVRMICVGTSEADSIEAVEFASVHEGSWAAVGVHPHDTREGWTQIEQLLKEKSKKVIAVGEIGLDYFYENSNREVQKRALEEQLQWAIDYDLPVSFHVREAFDDFWAVFDNFHGVRGVLHSFTDNNDNLEKGLKRGLYIGVNGISTFTKDESQKEMFKSIPVDRMLVETDAPFLTPVPFRGKVNEPAFVRDVARHQANIREMSFGDFASITTANAEALFAI